MTFSQQLRNLRVQTEHPLLQQTNAKLLMDKLQKNLLAGKGDLVNFTVLTKFSGLGQYEEGYYLVWDGTVAAPRPPTYQYSFSIIVGVENNILYINGNKLDSPTAVELQQKLLTASQKPFELPDAPTIAGVSTLSAPSATSQNSSILTMLQQLLPNLQNTSQTNLLVLGAVGTMVVGGLLVMVGLGWYVSHTRIYTVASFGGSEIISLFFVPLQIILVLSLLASGVAWLYMSLNHPQWQNDWETRLPMLVAMFFIINMMCGCFMFMI